ncbi:hypothetical protein B7494_g7329 [Chlorociboria aeruginascens]|nr:hypothetical protein B7494_g7329 [Chlorociboria aeruginascens]
MARLASSSDDRMQSTTHYPDTPISAESLDSPRPRHFSPLHVSDDSVGHGLAGRFLGSTTWKAWLASMTVRPRRTMNGHTNMDVLDDESARGLLADVYVKRTLSKKRTWWNYCIFGGISGLSILAFLLAFNLVLGLVTFVWSGDIDRIFQDWGKPGTGTEALAWYPTDFLRDVNPIPCHSHNDYWRRVPLFDALRAGCIGVEADVWLFDEELYVGHSTASLTRNRTFQSLYINPLVEILKRQNPTTDFYNDTNHGVFDTDPGKSLTLLVDLKTSGAATWPWVLKQLDPLRERGWLSYVENDEVHTRPITVVGTGNTPFDILTQNSTYRDAFFDAPLDEMWEPRHRHSDTKDVLDFDDPSGDERLVDDVEPAEETPPTPDVGQGKSGVTKDDEFNPLNSYYASVSFGQAVGRMWRGKLSPRQMKIIRGQVRGAHRRGLKARYWDLPSWPLGLRNHVWDVLVREGVDMLNVDDLRGASNQVCFWKSLFFRLSLYYIPESDLARIHIAMIPLSHYMFQDRGYERALNPTMSSRRKEVAEWLLERIRFFSEDCGISIHALFTALDLEFKNPPLPQSLKNEAYAALVKRPDIHFGYQELNVNNPLRAITLENLLADRKLVRKKIFIEAAEEDGGGLWGDDAGVDEGEEAKDWEAALKNLDLDPRLFERSARSHGAADGMREGTESSEREVLKSIEQPDQEVATPSSSTNAAPEVRTIDEREDIRKPEPPPFPAHAQSTPAIASLVVEGTVSPESRHSHATKQQPITSCQKKAEKLASTLEDVVSEVHQAEVPAIVEPKPTPAAVAAESTIVADEPNTGEEPNLDRRDPKDSIVMDNSKWVTADEGHLGRQEDPAEEAGEAITVEPDTMVKIVTVDEGTNSELIIPPLKRRGRPPKNQQRERAQVSIGRGGPNRPGTPIFNPSGNASESVTSPVLLSQTPTKNNGGESSLGADESITNTSVAPSANTVVHVSSRSHHTPPVLDPIPPPKSSPAPIQEAPRYLLGRIRRSIFVPQEELDREENDAKIKAGETGVYLNPTIPHPPQKKGRRSMFVLFKLDKLKDPNHLDDNKRSWIEPLAEKMATAILGVEDLVVEAPQKRKWTRKAVAGVDNDSMASNSLTRAKRQRTKKNASTRELNESFTPPTARNDGSAGTRVRKNNVAGPHIQASTQIEASISITQQPTPMSTFHTMTSPAIVAATPQLLQRCDVLSFAQPNQNTPISQSSIPSSPFNPFPAHLPWFRSLYASPHGEYKSPYAPKPSSPQVETPSQLSASATASSIPQPSRPKNSTPASSPTLQYPAISPFQPGPTQSQHQRPHLVSLPQPRSSEPSSKPTSFLSRTPTPITTQPSYHSPHAQEEADGSPSDQLQAELHAREEHRQSPQAVSWNHESIQSNNGTSAWSGSLRPLSNLPVVNSASASIIQPPYKPPPSPQHREASLGHREMSPIHRVGITTSKILSNQFFIPPQPTSSYKSPYQPLPMKAQEAEFSNDSFNATVQAEYPVSIVNPGFNPQQQRERKRKRKRKALGHVVDPLISLQGLVPEAVESTTLNEDVPRKRVKRSTESDTVGSQAAEMKLQVSVAENIPIPDVTARLSCIYTEIVGNLLLSEDKNTIIFIGINQRPPLVPILVLPTSKITQKPTSSFLGSEVMELQINALDLKDASALHKFTVFSTQSTKEAVNNMRSKIVVAMMTANLRGDVPPEVAAAREEELRASAKPFKCKTCGSRWKNKEGLDYHLRKSNTTCNPNFVPTDGKRRPYTRKKKTKVSPNNSKNTVHVDRVEDVDIDEETPGEDQDGSSESEDSILEWAERVSKNKKSLSNSRIVERSVPAQKKRKLYRSIPNEITLLQEVVREVSGADAAEGTSLSPHGQPQANKQSRRPFLPDEFTVQRACDIVLEIINENNSLFPGGRGLWYAFVGMWLLKYSNSGILPESKLCQKALDDLIENGQLKQVSFRFMDDRQRVCSRSIITKPNVDPKSAQIDELEKVIAASYPGHHVPAKLAPPEAILSKLRTLTGLANQPADANDDNLERPRKRARRTSSVYEELMAFTSETPISEDEFNPEDITDESEPEALSDDDFVDSSVAMETGDKRRLSAKESTNSSLTPQPRKRWRKPGTVPLTPEAKERRADLAAIRLQSWEPAPAFLPNPQSGAWDQTPLRVKKPHNLQRKPRLPEPITYMQNEDGAWCVRPFGHGVKPIFARPSRRADGNPGLQYYLDKVENGHRPVVMPTKIRQYLPAVPSKALLRNLAASPVDSPSPPALQDVTDDDDLYRDESVVDEEYLSEELEVTPRLRRRNTRRVPTLSNVSSAFANGEIFHSTQSSSNTIANRRTGNAARTRNGMSEAGILALNEPNVAWPQNPGLASLPSGFGLGIRQGLPAFQKITFLPPNMQLGVEGDDYASLAVPADHSTHLSPPADFKWLEENASTLLTLPYNELSSDEEGDVEAPPAKKQRIRKRRPNSGTARQSKRNMQRHFKSRILTAYVQDLAGIMGDPAVAASELGVQVVDPSPTRHRKKYVEGNMPAHLEAQLIVACVMIRILLGGLDLQIDWVIVGMLFPGYAINHLKKAWNTISETKKVTVDKLALDFRDAFLSAYENGEVAPIDYDHLPDYDWKALVDWAMENLDVEWTNKTNRLPASREHLEELYHFNEIEPPDLQEAWYNHNQQVPTYRRMEMVTAKADTFSLATPAYSGTEDEIDALTLARSWVRATALTPNDSWDPETAIRKLNKLGLPLVEEALQSLIASKAVKHRTHKSPGRSYEATDIMLSVLKKHINERHFLEAAEFKSLLDANFRAGKPYVVFDHLSNEGVIMCITNLQAHSCIRLEGVNIPMNKFGFMPEGSYVVRKMDRSKIRFDLHIYPTSDYIFDSDIPALNNLSSTPPQKGQRGELPLWNTIAGDLMQDMWTKLFAAVAGTVALRTGVNTKGLKNVFSPALEEWEIRRIMKWGAERGVFSSVMEGVEGWKVNEWWWLIVGRLCEGLESQRKEQTF